MTSIVLSTDLATPAPRFQQRRYLLQHQKLSFSGTSAHMKDVSLMTQRSPRFIPGHPAKQSQMSTHFSVQPALCASGSKTSWPLLSPLLISRERTLTLCGRTSMTRPWRASNKPSSPHQHSSPSTTNLGILPSLPSTHPFKESAGFSLKHVKTVSAAPLDLDQLVGMSARVATLNQRLNFMDYSRCYMLSKCT